VSEVLIDARPLQGPSGRRGIGRYADGLLRGLAELGYEHSVLVDAGLPEPSFPKTVVRIHATRRRWHGRLAGYEDSVALTSDLRRIRPALFHAVSLTLPGRSPCPVAVTVHDLIPWTFGGWRMAGERFRFRVARRLLPRAELVFAVSESTAADLRRLAGVDDRRIQVVHEGLDPLFRPRPDARGRVAARWSQERPYFLFVGALDVRKDPRGLLRAWAAAREAGADHDLLVAGDPGRQAPAEMGNARLLGWVTDQELADLLSAASCLLFPSLYEGFGLPPLEALGCGCPVVAYRNSSLPEVVGGAGVLVPNRDAQALGRAAARLVLDLKERRRSIAAGRKQAARFTWERAARATVAGYNGLLSG
jgi:glycosyltransferase involved in cell wall biosynthesis